MLRLQWLLKYWANGILIIEFKSYESAPPAGENVPAVLGAVGTNSMEGFCISQAKLMVIPIKRPEAKRIIKDENLEFLPDASNFL